MTMPNHNEVRQTPYITNTKIKDRPLAFVDLEFTGLRADHEILQIGVVLVHQPDLTVIGEWESKVQPEHIDRADPKALEMVGYTPESWRNALPLKEALEQFDAFVHDAVLIGYNVVWDFYQLKKSYFAAGLQATHHWQVLDVQSMAFAQLYQNGLNGFRMTEVVKYFALPERQWHDALADAQATYDIFRKLMEHSSR